MMMKQQQQQDAPEARPGVEVGDHLYVHHNGQPCHGEVLSHGRHGVTVRVDGKHARVKWDKVLGHKQRLPSNFKIIDHGDDGMLIEDDKGRRRYVEVPNDSREDKMIAKAQLLFIKSAPGPGLTQKQITDKNGVQSKRWVKMGAGGPPSQPGQHVGFKNGEHSGHGQVASAGKHGVVVRDAGGGEHRVTHDKITHQWQGEGAPDGSPHEQPEAAQKPASAGRVDPSSLFSAESVASLPDKVAQPAKSWDELVQKGTEGLEHFRGMMGKVQQAMGLKTGMKPEDITPEQWENNDGFMFIAPLKGEKRAKEKVEADYNGDWSQLRDIVRGTISVPTMGDVKQALEHMKAAGLEIAQKPKNRFEKPTGEGYRDLMTFVKLPNGMVAELQIHTKAMTLAKEKGHKDYEITRSLQGKYGEAEPSDKWSDDDHRNFYEAVKRQKDIYNQAWAKSNGGDDSILNKSLKPARMMVLMKGVLK